MDAFIISDVNKVVVNEESELMAKMPTRPLTAAQLTTLPE